MRAPIVLLLLALSSAARADVVALVNGDRLSGRILGATTRRVRLQTAYGTLVIPRDQVARLEYDDGRVEVVNAPPAPPAPLAPRPTPQPEPARLQLAVTGDSFWQAWDPKTAPADPSLRLELRLDDAPLVSYTDSTLDPEDLPKAVVNSFVFSPEELLVRAGPGVVVAPPIVVGDEIGLALDDPAGGRRTPLAQARVPAERGHRRRSRCGSTWSPHPPRSSSSRARRWRCGSSRAAAPWSTPVTGC